MTVAMCEAREVVEDATESKQRYIKPLTIKDVARRCCLSAGTVLKYIHLGRLKAKKSLKGWRVLYIEDFVDFQMYAEGWR